MLGRSRPLVPKSAKEVVDRFGNSPDVCMWAFPYP